MSDAIYGLRLTRLFFLALVTLLELLDTCEETDARHIAEMANLQNFRARCLSSP